MRTIRGRLTVWYSVALMATIAVFAAAVYFQPPRPSAAALDRRTAHDLGFVVRYLEESYRVLGKLVAAEPREGLHPSISAAFEGLQEYLVILGNRGQVLYLSARARQLPFSSLEQLVALGQPLSTAETTGTIDLGGSGPELRYRVASVHGAGTDIGGAIVATPVDELAFDPAALLRIMLIVAPFVGLLSVALGHWLAGRALQPVQGIIDELEAITDGRSLHRRLAVPMSGDEIARLTLTLNSMLARLEQSFASLRRFTADASHELKTPLMVLRAGVERVLTDPGTRPESLEALDETLQQINQMSEMVDNLLTLARADEGRAPLALERVDLRELVDEAAETAGILAEGAGLTVRSELPDAPLLIDADRHRIRELLLNLVTNAIKYTPSGGSMSLGLVRHEHGAVIAVHDTGIGIAAGDLPHIFDRFWRADPARSRAGEHLGVGLGLAITKWIAEAHGGSITVQSRLGRGTTFTVILPREGGVLTVPVLRDTPVAEIQPSR